MPALLRYDELDATWYHERREYTEPYPELPGICDGDGEIDPAMVHINLITLPEDSREQYLIDMEIDPATIGEYL